MKKRIFGITLAFMMFATIITVGMPLNVCAMSVGNTVVKDINAGNEFYFTCTSNLNSKILFKDEAGSGAWCEATVSVYDIKAAKWVVKNTVISTKTGQKTVYSKLLGKNRKYKVVVSKVVKHNNINGVVKLRADAVNGKFTKN